MGHAYNAMQIGDLLRKSTPTRFDLSSLMSTCKCSSGSCFRLTMGARPNCDKIQLLLKGKNSHCVYKFYDGLVNPGSCPDPTPAGVTKVVNKAKVNPKHAVEAKP